MPVRPRGCRGVAQVLLMIPAPGSFGPAVNTIFVAIIVAIVVDEDRDNDRDNDQRSLRRISSPVGWPCTYPLKSGPLGVRPYTLDSRLLALLFVQTLFNFRHDAM